MNNVVHGNSFNLVRLVFAGLVIFTHSYAIYDGNPYRDILYRFTGSLSLGDVAVDGFFIVSGFLITGSYLQSRSPWHYFQKRILRIYPAFLVCYLICITLVAAFSGATAPDAIKVPIIFIKAFLLASPTLGTEFPGMTFSFLNGSAWTIAYEFRCYVFLAIFGMIGLLERRQLLLAIFLVLLVLDFIAIEYSPPGGVLFGNAEHGIRFMALFLAGALHQLYRDRISYSARGAAICFAASLACMFWAPIAETGLCLFGAYVILWFALHGPLNRVGAMLKSDISYGLYLYGWPIQSLIIYYGNGISPMAVTLIALPLAALCGWISWHMIEKPALSLKNRALPVPA
jgi:peptidoglycan/LPS O-acetylase OafA/YrhL